jgi:hypothetical protein
VGKMNKEISIQEYTPDFKLKVLPFIEDIYIWVKDGMTDYSIAEKLGIHYNTFSRYKKEYNDISELYARATKERNSLVMNSMFKKANGEKIEVNKQKVLNSGQIVDYKEEQVIPADVNAADLFLRNNDPDYKSAKSEGLTLIQNTIRLPEKQKELDKLEEEIKQLEAMIPIEITDYIIVEK